MDALDFRECAKDRCLIMYVVTDHVYIVQQVSDRVPLYELRSFSSFSDEFSNRKLCRKFKDSIL